MFLKCCKCNTWVSTQSINCADDCEIKNVGSFGALRTSLSWRLLPNPRWNKAYREAQDSLDILLDFGKKHVQTAKYNYETAKNDTDQMSILKKMVRRCDPESSYPLVMALGE